MNTFIVRLELHPSDTEQKYNDLHPVMESLGFSRIYTDNTGTRYHLPPLEYCLLAKQSVEAVRDMTRSAVSKITNHFMIFATEAKSIATAGLVPVKEKSVSAPPLPVLASPAVVG